MLRQIARQIRRKVFPRRGKLAVGSVAQVAAVYDEVFERDERFDTLDISNTPKLKYVLRYAQPISGQVLDAGCGRGSVLRYMLDNGVDAFGVELSKAACDRYLQGLPHANADIISWSDEGRKYAGRVCTDVLEHIPPDQIHKVLAALAKLAPSGFLGIANHSSIHEGHELHVIQKGRNWWVEQLSKHYRDVDVVAPDAGDDVLAGHFKKDVFFFIRVASPRP